MGLTLHDTHGHSHGGMSHGHSHGGSHDHDDGGAADNPSYGAIKDAEQETVLTIHENKETKALIPEKKAHKQNINVRAAFIHVIGDFLQSVGVMIAAFIIYFKVK